MSLLASAKIRRLLFGLAAASGLAWFVYVTNERMALLGNPAQLAWTLLGAGLVLLALALSARRPHEACSFCGLPRSKVKHLVAGPAASICDACIPLSLGIVTEDLKAKKPPVPWQRPVVDGLPRHCPVAISRPLLEALAEATSDPAVLRGVVTTCLKLENPDLACQVVERIPVSDRLAGDWLDLGVAHGYAGRYADAVAATVTALNLDDGRWRPWCLNNRVWFGLRAQPEASAEVRAGWLRDLEEARRLLAEKTPPGWKQVTQISHGTDAEVHRTLGDAQAAFRALAEAEKLGPLAGSRLLVRARLLAMGEPPLGRNDAERALEALHPESLEAGEARALIARLDAASPKT